MEMTGNTIFITGGGSGIGRGLAEALHKLGNQVIISGRRKAALTETTAANPGMQSVELNVEDPASIAAVAKQLVAEFPALNVLINNAGIMKMDGVNGVVDDAVVSSTVTTNLLGPIRMTSALIEQLKATYCATKAALHSFALSQRYLLKETSVKVIEIAPPYVQTELGGERQKSDPRAMPLAEYIAETVKLLGTDADENLVERVKPLRNNAGPGEQAFVDKFNDMMMQQGHGEK
jgi:uncharacterized oxidoreductase